MVIGIIDIIVIITLVLSILFALYRGLVCELLCISSWILAGIGALYGFVPMKGLLSGVFDNEIVAGVVGSAVVALSILIVMTIVNSQITKRLRNSSLSGLDRILGIVFGGIRAALLLSLLYIGVSMILSEKQMADIEKENGSVTYIKKTVGMLEYFVPESVLKDLKVKKDTSAEKDQPKIGTQLKNQPRPKNTDKKALDSLIKEVKKDVNKKAEAVKQEVKKEVIDEVKKAVEPVKSEVVDYKQTERDSLDIMVEAIAGE
ncbi:MAG: CvpA family protein [Alphaproteobacteria bacterium]|nr:CvpA family protein [Alphaproteobacteria bacterium]